MAERYKHSPLSSRRSIRVLNLLPSPRDSALNCSLKEVSLDDQVEYEALSYAWGDEDPTGRTSITCCGKHIPITPNCSAALKHLRREGRPRTLWIDAICIDQSSVYEKNHQIPLMGDIYRNAKRTLMWLGEGDQESEQTLSEILILYARHVVDDSDQQNEGVPPDVGELIRTLKALDDAAYTTLAQPYVTKAAEQILSRPYFSRMWTIQEVALSESPILVIGDSTLDWSYFTAVVQGPKLVDQVSSSPGMCHMVAKAMVDKHRSALAAARLSDGIVPSSPLIPVLLNFSRWHESSDKRDRVYAVHSVLEIFFPGAFPEPDYSRTWTEVYTDTAAAVILLSRGSPEILHSGPSRHQALGLPSWVPDWSEDRVFDSKWPARVSPVLYKETDSVKIDGSRLSTSSVIVGCIGETEADTSHLAKELLHRPVATSSAKMPGWVKARDWSKMLVRNLDVWLRHVPQHVRCELVLRSAKRDSSETSLPPLDDHTWRTLLATGLGDMIDCTDYFSPTGAAWHIHKPMGCLYQDWQDLGGSLLLARELLSQRYDDNLLLFSLDTGYLGFSIHQPKTGDVVALLPGLHYPALLRPSGTEGEYSLLGFVWVLGVMNDEIENLDAFIRIRITIL